MEAILFIGLPASGKSSFYKARFFDTHVRISLDLLRTKHRERRLFEVCLETKTRLVIDKTNASRAERGQYIEALRANGYTVTGYYFQSLVSDCLARNALRTGKARIPDAGVLGTAGRLELPALEEGFSALYYVQLLTRDTGPDFVVEEWQHVV